ncbi:zinc ABC transporter substrate-binding protein [Marinibacterium profundimaris]|uniref:High-affinity zinc uptake system protein ZnuA n=1 Tax=Marinibacterium profundimaris TaxID=1679460 RepID=A0A225NK91_9RHOB|nr:zinc ABC transporter substrate-binding protein [Marinibacterium profundimaris]OWU74618.1 zinc transporter [Marinibacterium profundimaris]
MSRKLLLGAVSVLGLSSAAAAEVPSVAADIPPVHSLVSIVMGELGTPHLLVQPGASPHGYSLRPSEAAALNRADAVFWISKSLEPWLEGSIEALADNAHVIELMETDGTTELEFREGATFEAHSHDHEGHDDHEEANDHDHDHHDDDEHAHEGHDHHGHDPHAWLDPENARVWLDVIAAELSELDPENTATYRANAEAGRTDLESLIGEISAQLDPVRGANFIVFHDAYQYFENRFGFPASGSITLGDASDPSPARIEEIQHKVAELGVSCAFTEPQFNPDLVATVFRGTDAQTGIMDPLGAELEPGADLYPQLLRNLASSLTDCLG